MTVYVDDFRVPATVGRLKGRWSHLTADTPQELHELADSIGLQRSWFQAKCRYGKCPIVDGVCRHFHYDVVDSKRLQAVATGKVIAVDIREFGDIIYRRRGSFS